MLSAVLSELRFPVRSKFTYWHQSSSEHFSCFYVQLQSFSLPARQYRAVAPKECSRVVENCLTFHPCPFVRFSALGSEREGWKTKAAPCLKPLVILFFYLFFRISVLMTAIMGVNKLTPFCFLWLFSLSFIMC